MLVCEIVCVFVFRYYSTHNKDSMEESKQVHISPTKEIANYRSTGAKTRNVKSMVWSLVCHINICPTNMNNIRLK